MPIRTPVCKTNPPPIHSKTQTREYMSLVLVTKATKTPRASSISQPDTSARRSSTMLAPRCGWYSPTPGNTTRLDDRDREYGDPVVWWHGGLDPI